MTDKPPETPPHVRAVMEHRRLRMQEQMNAESEAIAKHAKRKAGHMLLGAAVPADAKSVAVSVLAEALAIAMADAIGPLPQPGAPEALLNHIMSLLPVAVNTHWVHEQRGKIALPPSVVRVEAAQDLEPGDAVVLNGDGKATKAS